MKLLKTIQQFFSGLGNESYAGDDIEAMNTYFKEKQDGRFVHYESSFYDRNYEETISDVGSRMYAKPYEVEDLIFCVSICMIWVIRWEDLVLI